MSLEDLLSRIKLALERVEIAYMLTGSVASSVHGTPRSTQDLDIVIAPTRAQLLALMKQFPTDCYYADEQQALTALVNRSQFNVIDFATGWKTDFIVAPDTEYARTAMSRRMLVDIGRTRVYVAAPEDVILAKLQWAKLATSERQIQDAAGIVHTQSNNLDSEYIDRWVRELGLQGEWQKVRDLRP